MTSDEKGGGGVLSSLWNNIKKFSHPLIWRELGMHRISARPDNLAFFISGIRPDLIRRISGWISDSENIRISGQIENNHLKSYFRIKIAS
jgi:hypothetical protein